MRQLHPPVPSASAQRVWALQVGQAGGKKCFLASLADVEAAVQAAETPLSLYEVVGSAYFDLEYSRSANRGREPSADMQLVGGMLGLVDAYCVAQGWATSVDSARTVVLDASDAAKFSQHLVVWLQDGAALSGVAEARALAAWVCARLPDGLLMAASADGAPCPVVDMHVYHKHQQMRLMGCVKLRNSRVLRCQRPALCSLSDSLLCVADPAVRLGGAGAQGPSGQQGTGVGGAAVGALATAVTHQLEAALQNGRISGVHAHSRHGAAHCSILAHTTSTACAHRAHASNRAVVEVDCQSRRWRLLCRDGCQPGAWQGIACAGRRPQPGCGRTVSGGVLATVYLTYIRPS